MPGVQNRNRLTIEKENPTIQNRVRLLFSATRGRDTKDLTHPPRCSGSRPNDQAGRRPCLDGFTSHRGIVTSPLGNGGGMWQIFGVDKITKRVVDVAVADNATEKRIILNQERYNYEPIWSVPIRLSWGKRGVMANA